ncbi:hypothetical protein [Glaciimonas soli]|uniref:Uncharacterized protein n=1 Tax=Glaciimonas soli TaxID=2590999 RepID=A0A843YMU4_9BURK|nr:hypothetical protein [Glaciimonas soli]MQR01189.1 hypothetical protein [Glaciimonas soli]
MSCQHCNQYEHLAHSQQIKTSKGLDRVIKNIRIAMDDGTLGDVEATSPCTAKMVFDNDCASDFLDLRFRCNHCSQDFVLSWQAYEDERGEGEWKIEDREAE